MRKDVREKISCEKKVILSIFYNNLVLKCLKGKKYIFF